MMVVVGAGAAILLCATDAFAQRGGGRGGGRGGAGMGGQQQAPQANPAIATDRTAIDQATKDYNAADKAYSDALKKFTEEFQKQPDYADALKKLEDATKEYDAARDAVIGKLKTNGAYKAAVQKEADAKTKLDKMRAANATRTEVSDQSMAIMKAGDDVSKLEADALAKDDRFIAAKKAVVDAKAAVDAEKVLLTDAVKADANLTTLATARDDAKTKLDDARKKLQTDLTQPG
jgi:hypothetical protein